MSHFVGAVVVPSTLTVDDLIARYEEEREVPKYLEYTRAQLVEKERADIEAYRTGLYARYLEDPAEYRRAHASNPAHLTHLAEEFPKRLTWSDDECYAEAIRWYEAEDLDADGNAYSTRNPDAKWDWWSLGGRWSGTFGADRFSTVAHAAAAFRAHEFPPRVLVTPGGEWLEKGEMGWWGISHGDVEDQSWSDAFFAHLDGIAETHPSAEVAVVDFHI